MLAVVSSGTKWALPQLSTAVLKEVSNDLALLFLLPFFLEPSPGAAHRLSQA